MVHALIYSNKSRYSIEFLRREYLATVSFESFRCIYADACIVCDENGSNVSVPVKASTLRVSNNSERVYVHSCDPASTCTRCIFPDDFRSASPPGRSQAKWRDTYRNLLRGGEEFSEGRLNPVNHRSFHKTRFRFEIFDQKDILDLDWTGYIVIWGMGCAWEIVSEI